MSALAEMPASAIAQVISRVAKGGEPVVVRDGAAKAAVISLEELSDFTKLKEQRAARLRRAQEAVERIRERAAQQGLDQMTDEEINAEISAARRAQDERNGR